MKPLTIVGIVLILAALVGFAFGGVGSSIRHFGGSDRDTLRSQRRPQESPWTAYLSTIALVAGLGMIALSGKAK